MTAVDFSFERPGAQALKDAGVVAVGRYLTGAGKAIDGPELQSYLALGIVVWFVFENTATDDQGGAQGGVQNATAASQALQALGLPVGCPVYFAVDRDLQNPADALPYFEGIASVRSPSTNGDYGEGALCQLLQDRDLTTYHWQSESTSFPGNTVTLPITHLQQVYNQQPRPGTDLDIILKPDFGQWPRPTPPVPPIGADVEIALWGTQQHVFRDNPDGTVSHWFYDSAAAQPAWHYEVLHPA